MQKPILVGGLGLSVGLAFLGSWQTSIFDLGEYLFWGAIAVGGFFLWQQKPTKTEQESFTDPLKKTDVEAAIATAKEWLTVLKTEAPEQDFSELTTTLNTLPQQFERTDITGAITGGRGTGKSTLLKVLEAQNSDCELVETKPLFTDIASYDQTAQTQVFESDYVLFLVTGDLMASQWDTLKHWRQARQKIILVFNKQDQYETEQRQLILDQLRRHVSEAIPSNDVLAIAAAPQPIKVKQIQEDGSEVEFFEQPEADVEILQANLSGMLADDNLREQLVWSTIWRNARLVQHTAKLKLNNLRKERALPILEKYQWIAAGATFANPVAALDLLATAAITGQMIIDVGTIYQQKISLEQSQAIATAIGKQMIQLGLVELSTQAIAGILKTNFVTYIAGGAVQGVSAAYLTHIAGLSLIQYFQEQLPSTESGGINTEKLGKILKVMFEQNQRSQFLQSFTQKVLARRSPEAIS